MPSESRLKNSVRNLFAAWGGQLVYLVFSFVTRGVFAWQLSIEYMGLENLFGNVLTILSLADLGIGSAVTFALYKPLAEHDESKVKALMRLFKRAYITIGVIIGLLGLILSPFVKYLIGNAPDIPYLNVYFFCFVLNTAISYFFSYKGSLIYANQKNYIVTLIQYGSQVLMCVAQIAVLLLTRNYLLFLVCMLLSTLVQNIIISRAADKLFPYLKDKDVEPLDSETLKMIEKNTFALVLHKIAGASSVPAGSLIVSMFVGIQAIAIYGNYMLVMNSLTRVLDKAFEAIIASAGNLGATESKERQYSVFKTSFFVNAVLYTVVCSVLLCCFNPVISLWLGDQYLFPTATVILLVFWLFVKGMRSAEQAFTSAYGLYWYSWYKALIEIIFLLVSSLLFVQLWGINGVIIAGAASLLFISTPMEVYVVFKYGFRRSSKDYFVKMIGYFLVAFALAVISYAVCLLLPFGGWAGLILRGCISFIVSSVGFCAIYARSREFSEFVTLLRNALALLRRKAIK